MKFQIYDGKTFEELCKDIVCNQNQRKDQIELLISDLKPLIKTVNDAMAVVPLIKQYIDSGISNDEHLVRLATVIQRLVSSKSESEGGNGSAFLTDEEKNQLLKDIEKTAGDIKESSKQSSIVVKSFKKE